ncbi:MAG: nickel-dependent lactate racemase [Pyrinomonadaceae bacterium]
MQKIDLKYGNTSPAFEYDGSRCEILRGDEHSIPLSDADIGERLDSPIDSPPLEEIVRSGDSVLIVVPDATRQTAAGQIVNLIVRRLIANGTLPFDIRIIFATGIHRKVTDDEKAAILTPFILQRIKTLDHDARDLMQIVSTGTTSGGIEIGLNRALIEHDHVVIVGGVSFHYFAGFTGGRKLICPGLASSRTIAATHKLAFDFQQKKRREGVDTGVLDGNAVHEAFVEVVRKRPPSFAISSIVNDKGEATELFCGDWQASHRSACDAYSSANTIGITEKRDLVIASCGGQPHDINLIQAHKTLDAAARACRDGGTIILLAECSDGLGRSDFLSWFETANSATLADKLVEKYQVNGQTAWSLLQKAETFDVRIVTDLDAASCEKMRVKKTSIGEAISIAKDAPKPAYLIPNGSKIAVNFRSNN